jgi:drug/metabolite transporter (DMT)-like permease
MFVGELTCLFVYFMKLAIWGSPNKKIEEGTPLSPGGAAAQQSQLKTKINPVLLAIPACCDICGSTLMFVALTQCAASVYQMMRGIIVVITAGMSILFLGAKQYAHHWISLMMIVAGVAIVGIVSVTMGDKDDDGQASTSITGVLLLLLA